MVAAASSYAPACLTASPYVATCRTLSARDDAPLTQARMGGRPVLDLQSVRATAQFHPRSSGAGLALSFPGEGLQPAPANFTGQRCNAGLVDRGGAHQSARRFWALSCPMPQPHGRAQVFPLSRYEGVPVLHLHRGLSMSAAAPGSTP